MDQSRWAQLNLRPNESPASWLSLHPELQPEVLGNLNDDELKALEYDWDFWARRNQLPPASDWTWWLVLAGRGFGKTRTGAEFAIRKAFDNPNTHGALIAPTAADARKVMAAADTENVDDASGIMAISPPWFRPLYEPSNRQLLWPNGTVATLYSAEEPRRLRGPQHHWGWVDEIAAWAGVQNTADDLALAWTQFQFGLRLGASPQACITTTPLPIQILRELIKDPATVITRGSTYENRGNLSPKFFATIIKKFEGTRIGRQELWGELLDDVPGALWTRSLIDRYRVQRHPDLVRVVVAVDPAGYNKPTADMTGICVVGLGDDDHGYTIADLSCRELPAVWGRTVVNAFWATNADCVVVEGNFGGQMVEHVIKSVDSRVPVKSVHASKGKRVRAEPVATMAEQGRDHHVGSLPELEDQMCNFAPLTFTGSPDRLDAKVWAFYELFIADQTQTVTYEDRVRISDF